MKISFIMSKKNATYVKKSFVTIKMRKINLDFTKARDHCHYTGKSRGAVHSICKLDIKYPKKSL